MERGIRRLEIFQDEFDYQVFLEILKKESEQKVEAFSSEFQHMRGQKDSPDHPF